MKKITKIILCSFSAMMICGCSTSVEPNPEIKPEPVINPVYSYVFNNDSPIKLVNKTGTNNYSVSDLLFKVDDKISFVDSSKNPYKLVDGISISGERYGFSFVVDSFKASIEGTYSFTLSISENGNRLTISKKEEPVVNYYTVVFDANGHGSAPSSIENVKEGSKINKPVDPSATGYIFEGWYKESSCIYAWNFNIDTVTSDLTLYAKWSLAPVEKYTVTFDTQGHGSAPSNQIIEKGSKVSKPADPTEEGFQFIGWYKESTCKNEWKFNVDTVIKDTTLYAKWEEVVERYFVVYADSTKPFDIDYGTELDRYSSTSYKVSLTCEEIRPGTTIKVVDSKNNEYKAFDKTTNSFTDYLVKEVTNGLQFVVFGSYDIELNPEAQSNGLKVVNKEINNYKIYSYGSNMLDYDDLNYISSSQTSIIYKYNNFTFRESYSYSIRIRISSSLYIFQNFKFTDATSTSNFTLNGQTFTYTKSPRVSKESFNIKLILDYATLKLELEITKA